MIIIKHIEYAIVPDDEFPRSYIIDDGKNIPTLLNSEDGVSIDDLSLPSVEYVHPTEYFVNFCKDLMSIPTRQKVVISRKAAEIFKRDEVYKALEKEIERLKRKINGGTK